MMIIDNPTTALLVIALFTIVLIKFYFEKKINQQKKRYQQLVGAKESLQAELDWSKLQNKMIIEEVQNFKDASKQLRQHSLELLVEHKELEERNELINELSKRDLDTPASCN
jgi:biopolymer transport protein ExbB/TolQ